MCYGQHIFIQHLLRRTLQLYNTIKLRFLNFGSALTSGNPNEYRDKEVVQN